MAPARSARAGAFVVRTVSAAGRFAAGYVAWVTAAEADAVRNTIRDVRIDDRGTWDKATWSRYLAAASVHELDFKPRIRRLLREIDSLEKLLAMPGAPIAHAA